MKSVTEIVAEHPQKKDRGCIAWSLELLLKVHDRLPVDTFPFQDGEGGESYGYDDTTIAKVEAYGVKIGRFHEPGDFEALVRLIGEKTQTGHCIVFTMPSFLYLDLDGQDNRIVAHAFAANMDQGVLDFVTWHPQHKRMSRVSLKNMAQLHHNWHLLSKVCAGLEGHLLNTRYARRVEK